MPEIQVGKIFPSAISSGSVSLKAYNDNGQQVGTSPLKPFVIIDLIQLQTEVIYSFDSDLLITFFAVGSAVNTTLSVQRVSGEIIGTLTTNVSREIQIIVGAGELLKLTATAPVNVRLLAIKSHIEVKL